MKDDPQRRYQAHGAALQLWTRRDDEIILSGPAGTGKSRGALEKVHACCLRWPGCRWLLVRKTRESLTESGLVTFERKVLPEGSPIAEGPARRQRQIYRYPNGSEIVVGGMDKPSKIMSTEFDGAYIQEAIELTEADWESITTRLRNGVMPFQQLLADTNPDTPTHWLRLRANRGDCVMLDSGHEDNPTLWDRARQCWTEAGQKYLIKLDRLTGARKERLRFGRWVQAEGVVYESFNRTIHIVDRFKIPPEWRRIRSIDFGYVNPFVCQWWAIDRDGRMYLYREIYMTGRTVAAHAKQILELSRDETFESTDADHDAEDRATLHSLHIHTQPAIKAIRPGIQAVDERLAIAGDGRPRLMIFRDALVERDAALEEAKLPCCTAEEFDGYVWPKGGDGKPLKETPVDLNNHGMDTTRYAVQRANKVRSPLFVRM